MSRANPFELDRVSIRLVKEPGGAMISDTPLNTPQAVAKLLHDEIFADLDRELFAVVNLKTSLTFAGMKVIAMDQDKEMQNLYPSSINICSMGSLNESVVHPREVVKSSVLNNAHAVFLIHNHPSGKLEPGKEDIQVTDRLIQAYDLMGIAVLDHIILGPQEQYYSFHEKGIFPLADNRYTTRLEELSFTGRMVAENSPSALERLQEAKKEAALQTLERAKRTRKKKTEEQAL